MAELHDAIMYHVLLQPRENNGKALLFYIRWNVETGEVLNAWYEEHDA